MSEKEEANPKFDQLREKAEEILQTQSTEKPNIDDFNHLLHELQVYQIELQTQNEELVASRQELNGIKNRYRELFESAPVGYFVLDENLIVKDINMTGAQLIGLPKKKCIKSPFHRWFTPSSRTILHDHFAKLFSNTTDHLCEVKLKKGDNEVIDVRVTSHFIDHCETFVDSSGRSIFVVLSDITEHKKAEEIIEGDRQRLQQLVKEKTDELFKAHQEVERSRRLSDLGQMAATIAHELRRPFAAIKLSIYNIRKKRKNPAIDKNLDHCDEKIFDGEQIINNILEFATLKEPVLQPTDLYTLITSVIVEVENHYTDDNIVITCDIENIRSVTARVDPDQFREVIANILQNACEALYDEPQGTITISGINADDKIGFRVSDNDQGIPEEYIDKVTNPFFSTKHRGVGLGLTITREIVALHNGNLEIESSPDRGTTVTVTLPRNS